MHTRPVVFFVSYFYSFKRLTTLLPSAPLLAGGRLQCAVAGSDHDTPRKRRIATVRASARCMLWSLRSADLLPALTAFPRVRVALIDTANSRLSQTCAMLAARLGTLLTDVIPDESRGSFFSQLAPCMRPLAASAGDILIRQGEVNDDLFFLCEGEVCIYLSACPSPSLAVGPRRCTAPQLRPTPLRRSNGVQWRCR